MAVVVRAPLRTSSNPQERAGYHSLGPGSSAGGETTQAGAPTAAPAAGIVGDGVGTLPGRSGLGHAVPVDAALPRKGSAFRPGPHRAVRLAAIPCCRPRLPVR